MNDAEIESKRNMLVVKDNDLIQQAKFNFTAEEQKFICYVISKIKPTDTEFQKYTISALDFAEITGIDKKNVYAAFRKMAKRFRENAKWIKVGDRTKEFQVFVLPEYNDKEGSITVMFDPDLKKYLIDMGPKYTKYELWNILSLKSKYSIRIYELFKSYAYKSEEEFEIEYLKEILCAIKYKSFGNFKQKVIDVGIKEINEYTDLKVSYETTKKGRGGKVSSITFIIKRKKDNELLNAYMNTCDKLNKKNGQLKGQVSMFSYDIYKKLEYEDQLEGQMDLFDYQTGENKFEIKDHRNQ